MMIAATIAIRRRMRSWPEVPPASGAAPGATPLPTCSLSTGRLLGGGLNWWAGVRAPARRGGLVVLAGRVVFSRAAGAVRPGRAGVVLAGLPFADLLLAGV